LDSVIVAPGIPRNFGNRVRIGDPVTLERPDGSILETFVTGIDTPFPSSAIGNPLQLGSGVTKEAVPIGTKLWIEITSEISN
jgi:hypothetical protein